MTTVERMEFLGHMLPPVLMLAGATILLQNQIMKGLSTGDPVDVLLVLAGVMLGSVGIERLLAMKESVNTRRQLAEITGKLDGLGQAEVLSGEVQIKAAALDLVSNCSPRSFVKATAQYVFTGGLDDAYYRLIRAKMDEAEALGVGFFYNLVVSNDDLDTARNRREPFFSAYPGRYNLLGREQHWPFDILIGGGRMIIAVSGQSGRSHNVGFYIKDPEAADAADQWFEEVIWDANLQGRPEPRNQSAGAGA